MLSQNPGGVRYVFGIWHLAAAAKQLRGATVRRIDETHANPLAAWIAMGAPDYTTAAQNVQLLSASQLARLCRSRPRFFVALLLPALLSSVATLARARSL